MLIRQKRPWHDVAERDATPESVFLDRRAFLASSVALAGAALMPGRVSAANEPADPSAALYPAKHNDAFTLDRPLTPETVNANYNNFYEYGTNKYVASAAQALKTRPWTVKIEGMVAQPREIAIDDLLKAMTLEERLYRHRCVEAWSMTVPWTGFPLKALVDFAKPLGSAKYVEMHTFFDPKMAPGQKSFLLRWPYVEGVTMAEAGNDLAFMVTGAYGKPLPKVFGAPLRLALPWKYGFKSIKSINRIIFTDRRPDTTWASFASSEYGFWANVNPEVPHPRWSQANEAIIGTEERRPTLLYNGYAEQVASLYSGLSGENLFM